jgi:hypothetical protein
MSTQMTLQKIVQAHDVLRVAHFTPLRNILLGAGLCFSIQQETYWHIPAVVLCPSVYAGYQTFKHKDSIVRNVRQAMN